MDKIKIKERLKTAGIILIGIIAISLILLLLYGLVTGRVQKTIVKYEALHYMENKYKEKFEIKQIFGADKIWKTSWGYELWMVPKNKPDKDYIYDMEVYVRKFNRNRKFFDNDSYKQSKLNHEIWKKLKIKIDKIITNEYYFYSAIVNGIDKEAKIEEIENGKYNLGEISIVLYLKKDIEKEKIIVLIKELNKIKEKTKIDYYIGIEFFNEENFKKSKKILQIENFKNYDYKIKIDNKNIKDVDSIDKIEKYIIYNRGN